MKPNEIKVLGVNYKIIYADNPSEVDAFKRESLWGQIDYWTRTIRIYDNGRGIEDIWETIFHEVLHAIGQQLHLGILDNGAGKDQQHHDELDVLALALTEVLFTNKLCFGDCPTNESEVSE